MKILVAGDFCPRNRVEQYIEVGDYSTIFGKVKEFIVQSDYAIVNFECPVVKGQAQPIEKLGPNLKCTGRSVEALKYAGFNCVTLANNHFLDYGPEGVKDTLTTLDAQGIEHVGGGMDLSNSSKILYHDIKGEKLAIINCCEHEFSIATENTAGSNPLNPIKQYASIQEARKKANRVIVIVHGGHEHFQLPSPRMVETYRFFIDVGADAVVNHHQHCYSGYEVYNGKPIFYGLGNFCFDNPEQHSGKWTEGYFVTIDFEDSIKYEIHPYRQCAEEVGVIPLAKQAFNDKLYELNSTIADDKKLQSEIDEYYGKTSGACSWLFEPIRTGLYYVLRYKGWLPSFVSRKRKLSAVNLILCEAYCDRMKWWLQHK